MRTRRVWAAAYVLAGAGLTALALAVPALYLVDLPAWTYAGAVWARELADPSATPAAVLRYPVPNAWATVVPGVLVPLVGAAAAGKVVGS